MSVGRAGDRRPDLFQEDVGEDQEETVASDLRDELVHLGRILSEP